MIPIVDGHNDTLLAATSDRAGGAFLEESDDPAGHLDLARAEDAGLAAGIFAAFVPNEGEQDDWSDLPPAVDYERARRVVDEQFRTLHEWAGATDRFRVIGDIDDLEACIDGDAVGAVPHIEGAVSPDLVNLDSLYETGLRSLGLVWSRPNAFAHGVPFEHGATPDIGPGLTEPGFDLVTACEERGILVDLAHLNAAGFWDVQKTVDTPLVVSHAGAHHISPASRNLTDDQLDAVAESGGLVGCTFGTAHLRPDGQRGVDVEGRSPSGSRPCPDDAPLSVLLDHIEYLADRMGVEHVALGSDFDGASIPDEVGDVRGLRDVLDGLEARGFDRAEREAIASQNWRRVLAEWWG